MTTVATGGFSTHDESLGYYQDSKVLWVAIVFMFLGGLPFSFFIALFFTRSLPKPDPQIYFFIIVRAQNVGLVEADESFSVVFPTIEAAFLDKTISDSLCGILSSSRSKRSQSKKRQKLILSQGTSIGIQCPFRFYAY